MAEPAGLSAGFHTGTARGASQSQGHSASGRFDTEQHEHQGGEVVAEGGAQAASDHEPKKQQSNQATKAEEIRMKELVPLGNHVLLQTREVPKTTTGGIHLPEQYQQPPGEGMVLAVGEGKLDYAGRMVPIKVHPGELVIFNWLHARDVDDGKQKFKLLDADQILAVKRQAKPAPNGGTPQAITDEMTKSCLVDNLTAA